MIVLSTKAVSYLFVRLYCVTKFSICLFCAFCQCCLVKINSFQLTICFDKKLQIIIKFDSYAMEVMLVYDHFSESSEKYTYSTRVSLNGRFINHNVLFNHGHPIR